MTAIRFPALGLEVDPSEIAFTLFGKPIYWYGIIIATGFILAIIYACWRSKDYGIKSDDVCDAALWATPVAIIGARLYYVVFNWSVYDGDPAAIIRIWDGGLAIYGAIIFGVLTFLVVCKVKDLKIGAMLDLGALGLLIGQAIGRWGNFINREAYGTYTDLPWRMELYDEYYEAFVGVHPTFLYESLWNVLGFILLHFFSKKLRKYDGQVFILYVMWYGLGRGMIEGLRTDSLYFFSTNLRVSQFVGFFTFFVFGVIFLYNALFRNVDKAQPAVEEEVELDMSEAEAEALVEQMMAEEDEDGSNS